MGFGDLNEIEKLIEKLKVNDHIKVQFLLHVDFEKIINLGEKAVNYLIQLYKKDLEITKWSTIYALQILCRIGGSKATQTLIDFFKKFSYSKEYEDVFLEVAEYMGRENHSSNLCVDTILKNMAQLEEKDVMWDFISYATEGGLRDERLFSLFLNGLDSGDNDVVLTSVLCLGDYADERAVPKLAELLKKFAQDYYEKGTFSIVVPNILGALQQCTTLSNYRKILLQNPWVVEEYINKLKEYVDKSSAEIMKVYSKKTVENEKLDQLAFEFKFVVNGYSKHLGLTDEREEA